MSTITRSNTKIGNLLRTVDARPTVSAYRQTADSLKSFRDVLRPVQVAMLSSFTIDVLAPYFEVEAARLGYAPALYHGPFNAVRQELLNPQSGCLAFQPDVVILAQLLEDICPPLVHDFLTLNSNQVEEFIANTIDSLRNTLESFRKMSAANIILYNFVMPAYPLTGIYESHDPSSQTEAIRSLNRRMVETTQSIPGVHILDFDRLCSEIGYSQWRHEEMWFNARAPLSPQVLPILGRKQATLLNAVMGTPRKCLVVDLDNTLWGGVLGEDGLPGIQIGHTYPGNVYREIQQAVVQLYRRGVILAICSKNNEEDVDEVFSKHPDMLLRREHFAAARVNWQSKADNLREIADQLYIGLDSFVFLDDSPAECEWMRQQLPQVMTWEGFNSDGQPAPLKILNMLLDSQVFDKLTLTDDDRKRNEMYQQQSARHALASSATSLEEFLSSLDMTVEIQSADEFTLPRIADLIQKTNQFNLTTRRHSITRLDQLASNENGCVLSIRVIDRFGDNGVVGVAIVILREEVAVLDTMLLSCRVIGRGVETAFLHHIAQWAKARGGMYLEGEFIATAKNQPAANFFANHGFHQIDASIDGSRWLLDLDLLPFDWPAYIQVAGQSNTDVSKTSTEEDRLRRIVGDVFGVEWHNLDDGSSPESISSWDSLNHLNLVMAIETEFDRSLSAKDIFAMQSIGAIRQILNRADSNEDTSRLSFVDCLTDDIPTFKEFIAKSYGEGYVLGSDDAYFYWQYKPTDQRKEFNLRLAKVDGKIAGCLGYIPVDYHVGGRKLRGGWLANWMVDPDYRHLGIGPLLARDVAKDFEITLALGANEEARDVLSGLGWTDFESLNRYVCVLDPVGVQKLTESTTILWPETTKPPSIHDPSLVISQVDGFDEDAERLWDELVGSNADLAGTRRTTEYLNWRYANHSRFPYQMFVARREGQCVGLAVYRVEQARGLSIRVGRLVELICHLEYQDTLLSIILDHARQKSAVAIDFFCGSHQFDDLLAKHGFLPGEDSRAQSIPMLYQPIDRRRTGIRFLADLRNVPEVAHVKHWYVTKSDGDQDRPN